MMTEHESKELTLVQDFILSMLTCTPAINAISFSSEEEEKQVVRWMYFALKRIVNISHMVTSDEECFSSEFYKAVATHFCNQPPENTSPLRYIGEPNDVGGRSFTITPNVEITDEEAVNRLSALLLPLIKNSKYRSSTVEWRRAAVQGALTFMGIWSYRRQEAPLIACLPREVAEMIAKEVFVARYDEPRSTCAP